MKKPDSKRFKKLIEDAAIGKYIGVRGAKILAEIACCEGQLALVKERKKAKAHVFYTFWNKATWSVNKVLLMKHRTQNL